MADNFPQTAGSGRNVATDEVTYSGDVADVQLVRIVQTTGAEGSKTVVNLPGDTTDGQLVNLGANNDVTVTSGSITANAGTNLNTSALALETGGNLAGSAVSLAILDDWDESDRAKVNLIVGQAGVEGGSGIVSALTQRVVLATDVALPAGTNNIGDVDVLTLPALSAGTNNIGDVDVLTIAAGTNAIGDVGVIPRTSGGLTTYHLVSAATTNATVVKASAGQLFGWFIYNNATTMRKLAFHNTASAPTAGASLFFTINLPGSSAANVFLPMGIAFSTGIAFTTVTDVTDAGTTAVGASDLTINLFYA